MKLFKSRPERPSMVPIRKDTYVPPYFYPILLVVVSVVFFALIADFYKAIVWALVFALLSTSLYEYLQQRWSLNDAVAAGMTTMLVVLMVVIPALAFGAILAGQATALVEGIQDGDINPAAPFLWLVDLMPRFDEAASRVGIDFDDLSDRISDTAVSGGEFVASKTLLIGQGALSAVLGIGIAIYLLFFFLYDGKRIMHFIYEAVPISGPGETYLFQEIASTARATIKGILVIGLAQGAVGGLAFALLGFSNAVLWGVAMAIATIIPAVGTAIVWVPASIALFAGGEVVKGVLMLMIGALVIGMIDNLLRPRVVGRSTRMPDYIVLLSTLGGLGAFGLTGIVLGPVIAAVFLSCWRLYRPEVSLDEKFDEHEAGPAET